jgi:hypothetical protein
LIRPSSSRAQLPSLCAEEAAIYRSAFLTALASSSDFLCVVQKRGRTIEKQRHELTPASLYLQLCAASAIAPRFEFSACVYNIPITRLKFSGTTLTVVLAFAQTDGHGWNLNLRPRDRISALFRRFRYYLLQHSHDYCWTLLLQPYDTAVF